jgi:hypothetical protein
VGLLSGPNEPSARAADIRRGATGVSEVVTVDQEPDQAEPSRRRARLSSTQLNSRLASLLILSAVAWRAWAMLQMSFFEDDWYWVGGVWRMSFWHYVIRQWNGHLQPGQFAVVWVATKIAPLNYVVVAIVPVLLLTLAAGWLMWRFLKALFGDRPGNLIPLAVFMLCPLSVPAVVWLAAALGALSVQLAVVLTLFAVLRYVRHPSAWHLVLVGASFVGGLLFWEKTLLVVPTAVVFVLLFLGEGRGWERLKNVTVGRWRLWATFAGVSALYLVWYLSATVSQQTHLPSALEIGRLARTTFLTTLIPTFLGGPWSLGHWPVFGVILPLGPLLRVLVWAGFAALVAISLVRRRQAWRGWVLALAYVVASIGIIVSSNRFVILGELIGIAARYFADCVPALALGFGLAYMVPLERVGDPSWGYTTLWERVVQQATPGLVARARAVTLNALRYREPPGWSKAKRARPSRRLRIPRWTARTFAVSAILLYGMSSLITGSKLAIQGKERSTTHWLANVKAELAAHPTASIFNALLPRRAVSVPFRVGFFPEQKITLKPISARVQWNAPSNRMLIFDDRGHLRPLEMAPITTTTPGPIAGCGYLTSPTGWFVAKLDAPLVPWQWVVRLDYFTSTSHEGYVTLGTDRQRVPFRRGLHSLTLIHEGTGQWVTVESPQTAVCVGKILVGNVRPPPEG